ncbi:MAG TPA: hypothetical protein PKV40_03995 [Candidatus Kapabacteria bacterium]|nr:hypothetical protein [Candidatus Kapabacteria bacterium]
MSEEEIKNEIIPTKTFYSQLDYYWKSLAIYAICLSIVILIRQTISQDKLIIAIYQPIILILSIIIIITTIALLYQVYLKREIIISSEGIKVSRRGFNKFYPIEMISWIYIPEMFNGKNNRNRYMPVVIHLKNNRKIRINPVIYKNDKELLNLLIQLKEFYKL